MTLRKSRHPRGYRTKSEWSSKGKQVKEGEYPEKCTIKGVPLYYENQVNRRKGMLHERERIYPNTDTD